MPIAEMIFKGLRGPADSPEFALRAAECEVQLRIEGQSYSNSSVELDFDGSPFVRTTQVGFHRFCESVTGKPARIWPEVVKQLSEDNVSLTIRGTLATVEQNLLKACFLAYLWNEPLFIPRPTKPVSNSFLDEFIIDNTGRVGMQPFIYFPPARLQGEHEAATRLYNLRLLCRTHVKTTGEPIDRIFTPLVVPGVLTSKIDDGTPTGVVAYKLWKEIREACDAAVRKFTQRNR